MNVFGVRTFPYRRWCWRLVCGEQGSQESLVALGIEDREPQSVGGKAVVVPVRDTGDEAVDPSPDFSRIVVCGGV